MKTNVQRTWRRARLLSFLRRNKEQTPNDAP